MSTKNPIRYTGQYFDEESGLYYLRARYYSPETMRFISEDTYKGKIENPLSLNYYLYCYGNPVMFSDPTGNGPEGIKQYDMGGGIAVMSATIKPAFNVKPKQVRVAVAGILTALATKQKTKDKEQKKENKGEGETVTTNKGNEIDVTPSSNHSTTTKNPGLEGEANSSVDILDSNGNIKTRRWYGSDGKQYRDVDFTNHGNPKKHSEWPHEHGPRS